MKQVTRWYVSLVFIIQNVAFELSLKLFFLFSRSRFPDYELKHPLPLKTNYSTQFAVNVTTPGACVCVRV
jgi:hypothetical protein